MAKVPVRCPILLAVALLAGCASRAPAPVVERGGPPKAQPATPAAAAAAAAAAARPGEFHTVKKGETLYSIALEHGQSYRDVAAWNNIDNPNRIRVGQELRVAPPESVAIASPVVVAPVVEVRPAGDVAAKNSDRLKREPKGGKQPYSEQAMAALERAESQPPAVAVQPSQPVKPVEAGGAQDDAWAWPSVGRLLAAFEEGGNKGIDIEGRTGDPVLAAEAGKVTYAGSGIRGYGNLLIIQHANGLSSVYAHNSRLLAKEGQQVARGQKIAELGSSDSDQPKLHFEIRRQGKPLDPLKLLPPR